ncbi:MAG: aromatic ring-hydroxylating dioxygenase subunit alpha [Gammaproteobacteria bacterium]|nr:aromatic ring-hydroxylating dioxygenase subunit alpha [Gammaproteobacteria bacterium]
MTRIPEIDTSYVNRSRYLQAAAYADLDLLAVEIGLGFRRHWISIGVTTEVQLPGSALPVDAAGCPLLMTRDLSGTLHVFHNVCRHQGTRLVDAPCRRDTGQIVCPYHSWTYGLDGRLRATPYWDRTPGSAPSPEEMERLALLPARFAVWFDTVFVDLSGTAPPFEEWIAPLASRWSPFDQRELRRVVAREFRLAGNWKLACENFLDGYHVPWVHSQIGAPATGVNYSALKLSGDLFGAFMPQGETDKPRTADRLPSFPGLPREFIGSQHFIYAFPNTLLALTPDWFQVFSVFPDGVDRCVEYASLYLVGDGALAPECAAQRDEFIRQMWLINEQDVALIAKIHAGRSSPASDQGSFAPYWDELSAAFHARIGRLHGSLQTGI